MYSLQKTVQLLVVASFVSVVYTETPIKSEITGYGYASSSNTLSTGAQGSEHSATFTDPGDCATNDAVYPIGTKIYVVGLQKYFSVQDSCGACSSESQPHFDLWMGAPSYSNKDQLTTCADGITVSDPTAAVIIDPEDGYVVDPTPLMSSTGVCDTNADYSRTQPVLASGGSKGTSGSATTLQTVVSPATSTAATQGDAGSGSCDWRGHCEGAHCRNDNDCGDPYSFTEDVIVFLDKRASFADMDDNGMTLLHLGFEHHYVVVVDHLLNTSADFNAMDKDGRSALPVYAREVGSRNENRDVTPFRYAPPDD